MDHILPIYIKTLLRLIQEKCLISTFASRTFFIYSSLLYNSFGYITNMINTDGFKNMINIEFEQESDTEYYLQHICLFGLSLLNETFNSQVIYNTIVEQSEILLNNDKYNEFKDKFQKELNQIELDLHDYYYLRDSDGWHDSNEQINFTNKTKINLNSQTVWDQIDLYKWTGVVGQQNIGTNWGKIPNLLNIELINKIEQYAEQEYKLIDLEQEHYNVLSNSLILSLGSRYNSEFWMRIEKNITLIGFYNYLLASYIESNYLDLGAQIKFFHLLNIAFFESTILTYRLKYKIEDPRPIQIIRGIRMNQEINYYFGKSDTNNWFPYKDPNTGLSSSPDYPSDIAIIGSVGSFCFGSILSENLVNLDIKLTDSDEFIDMLKIVKDSENKTIPISLTNLIIDSKLSQLESKYSNEDIPIIIENWDNLAKLIGLAPVCSGDSTMYSNQIGLNIGLAIGKLVLDFFIH